MKVGDLVKYRNQSSWFGFGIVLKNTNGYLDVYWVDDNPDYICESSAEFEVICENR